MQTCCIPASAVGSISRAVPRAEIDCEASVTGNARVDAQISSQLKMGRHPTTPKSMEQPQQLAHSSRIGASREDSMLLLQLEGRIFCHMLACISTWPLCSDSCSFPSMSLVKAMEAFQEQASLKNCNKRSSVFHWFVG